MNNLRFWWEIDLREGLPVEAKLIVGEVPAGRIIHHVDSCMYQFISPLPSIISSDLHEEFEHCKVKAEMIVNAWFKHFTNCSCDECVNGKGCNYEPENEHEGTEM